MNCEEYILIGGRNDGNKATIPDDANFCKMPIRNTINFNLEEEVYQRMSLSGESERFSVFAISGMSGNTLMRRLIDGYKSTII